MHLLLALNVRIALTPKSVACSTAAVAVGLPEKMLQLSVVSFDEVVAWE